MKRILKRTNSFWYGLLQRRICCFIGFNFILFTNLLTHIAKILFILTASFGNKYFKSFKLLILQLSGILAYHGPPSFVSDPSQHVRRAKVGWHQDQPTAPSTVERVHRRHRSASRGFQGKNIRFSYKISLFDICDFAATLLNMKA